MTVDLSTFDLHEEVAAWAALRSLDSLPGRRRADGGELREMPLLSSHAVELLRSSLDRGDSR